MFPFSTLFFFFSTYNSTRLLPMLNGRSNTDSSFNPGTPLLSLRYYFPVLFSLERTEAAVFVKLYKKSLIYWRFYFFLLLNPPPEHHWPSEPCFVTVPEIYFDILFVWSRRLPFTLALIDCSLPPLHALCTSPDESGHRSSLRGQEEK